VGGARGYCVQRKVFHLFIRLRDGNLLALRFKEQHKRGVMMKMTSRTLIAAPVVCTSIFLSGMATAHHAGDTGIWVEVESATLQGQSVIAVVAIFNGSGSQLSVEAVTGDGFAVPFTSLEIAPEEIWSDLLVFEFQGKIPGIFTAIFDFSEKGAGPVIVTPIAQVTPIFIGDSQ
jgi:hypothetical protein